MDKENATFVGTCQFAIKLTSIKLSQLASILSDFDRTKKGNDEWNGPSRSYGLPYVGWCDAGGYGG